jgi:magnesium-dependent phosphatase-1
MLLYPDCCPRILFLDLDGTVWESRDISSLEPPFKRHENMLVDSRGRKTRMFEGIEEFLANLKSEGLKIYSLSWNNPLNALAALRALGIDKYFDGHYIEPHPRKGIVMRKALEDIGNHYSPREIVYIDDRDIHIEEIRELVGEVCFIQMWKDVSDFRTLLHNILKLKSLCTNGNEVSPEEILKPKT